MEGHQRKNTLVFLLKACKCFSFVSMIKQSLFTEQQKTNEKNPENSGRWTEIVGYYGSEEEKIPSIHEMISMDCPQRRM